MKNILYKYSRFQLVVASTIIAIIATQFLMFSSYALFSANVRTSEIIIGTIAPLVVASSFSWFFISLILKLNTMESEMRTLATYDHLTKTLMRKEFFNKVSESRKIIKREQFNSSFMMIDIDHFKKVNDTYGHLAGDYVLSELGGILNDNKRDVDLVARFGGEEFILFLWGCDTEGALKYAENIQNILEHKNFNYNGINFKVTVSIGGSHADIDNQSSVNELIEQADTALYRAKRSGRNKSLSYKKVSPIDSISLVK